MEKKAPILWEKYEYQFPRLSAYNGFCRMFPGTNFPDYGKLMRKQMNLPYGEVYHKMGI